MLGLTVFGKFKVIEHRTGRNDCTGQCVDTVSLER